MRMGVRAIWPDRKGAWIREVQREDESVEPSAVAFGNTVFLAQMSRHAVTARRQSGPARATEDRRFGSVEMQAQRLQPLELLLVTNA